MTINLRKPCFGLLALASVAGAAAAHAQDFKLNSYVVRNGILEEATTDPALPSVVVTHGWQHSCGLACDATFQVESKTISDFINPAPGVFRGLDQYPLGEVLGSLISRSASDKISFNILTSHWRQAYQPSPPLAPFHPDGTISNSGLINGELEETLSSATPAGQSLANSLSLALPNNATYLSIRSRLG